LWFPLWDVKLSRLLAVSGEEGISRQDAKARRVGNPIFRQSVDSARNAVLHKRLSEVQQEAQLLSGETQIRLNLFLVRGDEEGRYAFTKSISDWR
jgi:hypothetical protein